MDLPRTESIYEILMDTGAMDEQAFRQALQVVRERIHVFTAPKELLPLDLIGPEDVTALIELARKCFDVVIVDLPGTLTQWTDTVLEEADMFHAVVTMEVRSAQNALRLMRLMEAESIPSENMRWILNRAPGRGDFQARGRVAKMAESLGVEFAAVLPDGGRAVSEAGDQALPLMQTAARSPLRKELARLARELSAAAPRHAVTGGPRRGPVRPVVLRHQVRVARKGRTRCSPATRSRRPGTRPRSRPRIRPLPPRRAQSPPPRRRPRPDRRDRNGPRGPTGQAPTARPPPPARSPRSRRRPTRGGSGATGSRSSRPRCITGCSTT